MTPRRDFDREVELHEGKGKIGKKAFLFVSQLTSLGVIDIDPSLPCTSTPASPQTTIHQQNNAGDGKRRAMREGFRGREGRMEICDARFSLGVSGKVETISGRGRDKLSCPALGCNWTTGAFTSADHLLSRKTGNMKCEMSMLRVNIERRVQPFDRSRISLNSCCYPKSDMNEADPHASKDPPCWEPVVRLVACQSFCLLLLITRM